MCPWPCPRLPQLGRRWRGAIEILHGCSSGVLCLRHAAYWVELVTWSDHGLSTNFQLGSSISYPSKKGWMRFHGKPTLESKWWKLHLHCCLEVFVDVWVLVSVVWLSTLTAMFASLASLLFEWNNFKINAPLVKTNGKLWRSLNKIV